jgi:hypothetical protein
MWVKELEGEVRRGYIHGGLEGFEIVWTNSKHLADGSSPTSCGKQWNGREGLANVTQTPLERVRGEEA